MKIERLPNEARVVQVRFMSLDGIRFAPPDDFESLLCELCEADGMSNAVGILDIRLKEILYKTGLIDWNVRGGCYATAKLKKTRDEIIDVYLAEMPDAELGAG